MRSDNKNCYCSGAKAFSLNTFLGFMIMIGSSIFDIEPARAAAGGDNENPEVSLIKQLNNLVESARASLKQDMNAHAREKVLEMEAEGNLLLTKIKGLYGLLKGAYEHRKTDEDRRNQELIDAINRNSAAIIGAAKISANAMKQKIKEKYGARNLAAQDKKNQRMWKFFGNKKNIYNIATGAALFIGSASFLYFTFKYAIPVLTKQIEKILNKPRLIQDSSIQSVWEKIKRKKKSASNFNIQDIVLPEGLKRSFEDLAASTKENRGHGLGYSHSLFYGPPGTGKTFSAKILAQQSGIDWVIIAGSAFDQFSEKEALIELDSLFQWSEKSKNGLLIFVDEVDSMLGDRYGLNPKHNKLVNMFLSHVDSTTHEKFMFVFATNHPQKLDKAVRSRISNMFYFPLPDKAQRLMLLEKKMGSELIKKGFTISTDVKSHLKKIADEAESFSGRSLLNVVTQCREAIVRKKETILNKETLLRVFKQIKKAHLAEQAMDKMNSHNQFFNPNLIDS